LDAVDRRDLPPRARCSVELIRAEALAEARLADEARSSLRTAEALWERAGAGDWVVKVRVEAARLSLLAGDPRVAQALADSARRSFAAAGQPVYAARATELAGAAAIGGGELRGGAVRAARRAAGVLAESGWRRESLRVRLLAARAAVELGRLETARAELEAAALLGRR